MSIIKRRNKISLLTPAEVDGNFDYIETELNNSPRLVKNDNDEVTGITNGIQNFTISEKPVEHLSNSAIPVSCSLTAVDEVLESFTIRADVMGVNSILQIEPLWTFTNSANNKILKVKIDGTTIFSSTRTTTLKDSPKITLSNRNSLASQICIIESDVGIPTTYTINFANSVTVDITGQRTNSSDTLTLEYYRVIHFVGN